MKFFSRISSKRVPSFKKLSIVGASIASAAAITGVALCAETKINYDNVKQDIAAVLDNEKWDDGSLGPLFVRLAWHASGTYDKNDGTGGSDGATMRFEPEAAWGANAGLGAARNFLEPIKAKYPGLSYADLWTLAGAVSIESMGGPSVAWNPGRSDASSGAACPKWNSADGNGKLPDATKGADHIRTLFGRMGFNDREMVALIGGGHSIGRCHPDRSGFTGPWTFSPTTFSNQFFVQLLENEWKPNTSLPKNAPFQYKDAKTGQLMMLPADLVLRDDPAFRKISEEYAKDEKKLFADFSAAFQKLEELGCPKLKKSQSGTFTPLGLASLGGFAATVVVGSILGGSRS